MLKKLKNKKGFTLIEIIVVIVILAVLMAVAVPSVLSYINEGNNAKYETAGHSVYTAIQTQYAEDAADSKTNDSSYSMKIKKTNLDGVDVSDIKFSLNSTKSNVNEASCKIKIDNDTRAVKISANKKVWVSDNENFTADHPEVTGGISAEVDTTA